MIKAEEFTKEKYLLSKMLNKDAVGDAGVYRASN